MGPRLAPLRLLREGGAARDRGGRLRAPTLHSSGRRQAEAEAKAVSRPPLCKICRERPAAVPDRNKPSLRWRREICRECHAERLRGDMAQVLAATLGKGQGE